jgi:hypothetical protein
VRGVIYEHQAAAAIDTARVLFPRLGDAIELLEWALVRDPKAGTALADGSNIWVVVFQGAASVGLPTIEVIYEIRPDHIVFHDLEFRK